MKYTEGDYARAGNKAASAISLDPGPLEQFPYSRDPRWGEATGPVHCPQERGGDPTVQYEVCRGGNMLILEQTQVLELFRYKMAEFEVTMKYMWDAQSGRFQQVGDDLPETRQSH